MAQIHIDRHVFQDLQTGQHREIYDHHTGHTWFSDLLNNSSWILWDLSGFLESGDLCNLGMCGSSWRCRNMQGLQNISLFPRTQDVVRTKRIRIFIPTTSQVLWYILTDGGKICPNFANKTTYIITLKNLFWVLAVIKHPV